MSAIWTYFRWAVWALLFLFGFWAIKYVPETLQAIGTIFILECTALVLSTAAQFFYTHINFVAENDRESLRTIFLSVHLLVAISSVAVYISQFQ